MRGRRSGILILPVLMAALIIIASAGTLVANPGMGTKGGGSNFHNPDKAPKVDYDGLFAAAVPVVSEGPGRMVLDACIEAYGGREKLAALNDYQVTWGASDDGGAVQVRTFAQGRRYKFESGTDARYLNGDECWYTREQQVAPMDGGRYRAELYSYLAMAMPLAAETERYDGARYGKQDGSDLDYLYFDKADSVMVVLGLDPESHLIRVSTGIVRQGDMDFVFINEFDDYRQVEGFWFPHKRSSISMGMRMGETILKDIKVNQGFEDAYFRPRGD